MPTDNDTYNPAEEDTETEVCCYDSGNEIYYYTFYTKFNWTRYHTLLNNYIRTRTQKDLELLYIAALPLLGTVIHKHFYKKHAFNTAAILDDLIGDGTVELLRIFMEITKRRYTSPMYVYSKLLIECKQTMGRLIRVNRVEIGSEIFVEEDSIVKHKPVSPLIVDNLVYLEQLKNGLEKYVRTNIRFTGNERKACLYIFKCLLSGESLVKNKKNIMESGSPARKIWFFCTYVVTLCRSYLIKHRDFFDCIVDKPAWTYPVYTDSFDIGDGM